jgi:transcriptional regulator with GAF, ATPase, and Fis domain
LLSNLTLAAAFLTPSLLLAASTVFYRQKQRKLAARRTEELQVLTQIGRALGSSVDQDALLEEIYSEIKRLLPVCRFSIAFHNEETQSVRFEMEVNEAGQRLPKRSRPAGNHIIEYIVRTRQPALIRKNYQEEAIRLGF